MRLDGNALTGTVPVGLLQLTSLQVLVISDNQFVGSMAALPLSTSLTTVVFTRNCFTATTTLACPSLTFTSTGVCDAPTYVAAANCTAVTPPFALNGIVR